MLPSDSSLSPSRKDSPVLRLQAQGLGLRQFRRVYDLEVNVTQQPVTQIDDAVMQLTNGLLALTSVLAQVNPDLTKGYLGMAMHGSVEAGYGDSILKAIWEKAFPGAPLPIGLSPEDFAKRFGGTNA